MFAPHLETVVKVRVAAGMGRILGRISYINVELACAPDKSFEFYFYWGARILHYFCNIMLCNFK